MFIVSTLLIGILQGCELSQNNDGSESTQTPANSSTSNDENVMEIPTIEPLTEEKVREICEAYVARENNPKLSASDLELEYYGEYDGAYALFVDGPWDYATVETEETVGGLVFKYSSYRYLNIYYNKNFYRLNEAFKQGIISIDNLKILHSVYKDKVPYLY